MTVTNPRPVFGTAKTTDSTPYNVNGGKVIIFNATTNSKVIFGKIVNGYYMINDIAEIYRDNDTDTFTIKSYETNGDYAGERSFNYPRYHTGMFNITLDRILKWSIDNIYLREPINITTINVSTLMKTNLRDETYELHPFGIGKRSLQLIGKEDRDGPDTSESFDLVDDLRGKIGDEVTIANLQDDIDGIWRLKNIDFDSMGRPDMYKYTITFER